MMIPLFKVRMSDKAPEAVEKVLRSGFIGQGPVVEEFEDMLWKELGTKTRPVSLNSCTSAIDLALHLCGVGPGDEVITSPQTCFATQIGSIHRHARIRWADIDSYTGLIDPDSVRKLVSDKTKAILSVNWAGKICNFKKLKVFGIPVIEDAAHTWDVFMEEQEKPERGDYVCYSFQAIKLLTTGDGGALICPNKEKEEEARILRWYGLDRTKGQSFRCTQNIMEAGFKYHMNDINASIGVVNIPEARDSVIKHRKNSKILCENINNPHIICSEYDDRCSYWLHSIHVINNRKPHFMKYMEENGIAVSPVHFRNDMYTCVERFKEDYLPEVSGFDMTQVCIPNGWWLSEKELSYIINTVNNYE